MAPRRNTNRNGSNAGRSTTVSSFALREARPIPYVQTPPSDPPSIRRNRPVDLQLEWKPTATDGTYTLTYEEILIALADYGYDGTSIQFWYTVNYVHAWADSSLDAVRISLYDVATGVSTSDNGATTHRARVGIHYPKVLQVPHDQNDTGNIMGLILSTGDPSQADMRIGVTIWLKPSDI
jgi:hypothetical protein